VSYNSEILIIRHLGIVVLRSEVLLFARKRSFINGMADLRDMFNAFKAVCTSAVVVTPDPLLPTPSTSTAIKSPENTEDNSDDPEPATEGVIQMEYFSN
jgi:hypothetical protein